MISWLFLSCVGLALASQDCTDGVCPQQTKGSSLMQTRSRLRPKALLHAKPDGGKADCESDVGEVHELTVDGKARCFNLYVPPTVKNTPLPVVVFFHGMGGAANRNCKAGNDLVSAADRIGYALVCGDSYENWVFPEFGGAAGTNSSNPTPCTSKDSSDVDYVQGLLDKVKAISTLDKNRIYFQGFSQGSMFTTWATVCFANQITGATNSGSGLKVGGAAVTEDWCSKSSNTRCTAGSTDGVNIPKGACSQDGCEFFPIKPSKLTNSAGKDLHWCIFAGCSDYLLTSCLSHDQYLTQVGAPHTLIYYDGPHKVPETNWMDKVAQCHGWPEAVQVNDSLWFNNCDSCDVGTNDGKICWGETGCGGKGGGGGGGGSGGSGDTCPKYCTDRTKLDEEKACRNPRCDGCDASVLDCSGYPPAPAPAPQPDPDCKSHCSSIPLEWDKKCNFNICMTCPECD